MPQPNSFDIISQKNTVLDLIDKIENKYFVCIDTGEISREYFKDFLEKSDYFTAPASSKYHSNFEGGLCTHSLKVYSTLKDLSKNYGTLTESEIIIIGLFHDVCKINTYKKNILKSGIQSTSIPYECDDELPLGHGEKSIYLLSKFFELSPKVAMCIRWHMGLYDREFSKNEYKFKNFPEVYLTYFADHISTLFIETHE